MTKQDPAIPAKTFREIAQNLLVKTQARQVNWVKADSDEPQYEVVLPESRIVLSYTSPLAEPDSIILVLRNAQDGVVGSWSADQPDERDPDPDPDWPLLHSLFAEVHRSVTGWDKVVSDINKALAGQGPIGVKPH